MEMELETKKELIEDLADLRLHLADVKKSRFDTRNSLKSLQASEIRYRRLFETAQDGILILNAETGQIDDVNPYMIDMLHYSYEEFLGKQLWEVSPFKDTALNRAAFEELLDKGYIRYKDLPLETKEGKPVAVEFVSNIYKANGNKVIQCNIRNITERKRAEEALSSSQGRLHTLVQAIPDLIWLKDKDGVYLSCNIMFERFFGAGETDIVGKTDYDFVCQDLADAIRELDLDVMAAGKPTRNEEWITFADDGHRAFLETIKTPMHDARGNLIGVLGIGRDITERRQTEEERAKLQKQLIQAQKMESVGRLAGGIAHDFNNLLMGIQGYASLALLTLDPSHPNYERLKRIEEQVQSGADLTGQLLAFARGGRYEVKPTDMNGLLEKTSSMFERTKKEISIHRNYCKDLWNVEVDRGQMEQVFMNLYVNAWQAMPGGGEIYLETEKIFLNDDPAFSDAVKPGRYIRISMTDTGTGMDEKTRERIFDPFFTTKEMGRGTGLGLATVYGIIKGHKGMINVYSEPGHGTTFTIYLPASEKEVVKEKAATATIVRGTETILLVDDERMVLEVNKELLEYMGYRVQTAGNGQEAIAVYMEKRNEIDLVILDMIMPGISGGETFDRLREINPGVKILLSSGYSVTGQAQEILDRGCNGFLQKPFQLENLSLKVREVLGG